MERKFGKFTVSALGYGAMPLSFGETSDDPSQVIHAALDAGITLIDTADIYAPSWDQMGHNERLVAEGLRTYDGDTSRVVVATKAGITRAEGEQWGRCGTLDYLRSRAEAACRNLGVERLDLLYLHRPDRSITYADSIRALQQLKADGLTAEVGISNANVEEIEIALDVLGAGQLAAVQNEFSPWFHHTSKPEMELCAREGIAFVPFSPLGGTGGGAKRLDQRFPSIRSASQELGISPQRVTLAWELSLGEHIIPIPGASRVASITDSAAALHDTLPAEVLEAITAEVF